jgi:CRISPR-associated protein Cmr3
MTTYEIRFTDTAFFREPRPMEAAGSNELLSIFPPPTRSVVGMLRTAIGDHVGVDWQQYGKGNGRTCKNVDCDLIEEIGDASGFGKLRVRGPWLYHQGQRLYPVPANLMQEKESGGIVRLQPEDRLTHCDLGQTFLCSPPQNKAALKEIEGYWLSAAGFEAWSQGKTPEAEHLISEDELWSTEPRLGIARDNQKGTTLESMLFQTAHVRPRAELSLRVQVHGVSQALLPKQVFPRFGAEGRVAELRRVEDVDLVAPSAPSSTRIALFIGTALSLGDQADSLETLRSGLLPGFKLGPDGIWAGNLGGQQLEFVSACVGRVCAEGGWDLVRRTPRPLVPMLPEGSVYFLTPQCSERLDASSLHDSNQGHEAIIGRGEILLGTY